MDIAASSPFSEAFDFASEAITHRFQNPFWKISEAIMGARLRKAVAEVKKFGREIVFSALARKRHAAVQVKEAAAKRKSSRNNLIDNLLNHIDDHQVVADAAMNFLSAGLSHHSDTLNQPAEQI